MESVSAFHPIRKLQWPASSVSIFEKYRNPGLFLTAKIAKIAKNC